jgi:hypothetical protein
MHVAAGIYVHAGPKILVEEDVNYRFVSVSENAYGAFIHLAFTQGVRIAILKLSLMVVVSAAVQVIFSIGQPRLVTVLREREEGQQDRGSGVKGGQIVDFHVGNGVVCVTGRGYMHWHACRLLDILCWC